MAKPYFEKLSQLITDLRIEEETVVSLEVKHFFNGAALYANGVICASWSPMGLAFKLPKAEVAELINSGQAKPLKYFEKGHVKKNYALFDEPEGADKRMWKSYFLKILEQ